MDGNSLCRSLLAGGCKYKLNIWSNLNNLLSRLWFTDSEGEVLVQVTVILVCKLKLNTARYGKFRGS